MKTNHVEWLLFSNDDQKYYSLITCELGGQADMEAAIAARRKVIHLRWVGRRNIGEQAPLLARRMFPLDMAELDKFQIISCFKEYVQADIEKLNQSSEPEPEPELELELEPEHSAEPKQISNRMPRR